MADSVRAPFPWFGGKRRVADVVWRAFGSDVPNYIEPFAGSLAVLLARPGGAGKIETVNDADRYLCVAPETRVLMSDLSYRAAGDLQPGDDLMAFDEENPGAPREGLRAPSQYRRWRHSKVVAAPRVKLPCYRLTFDDGTTVVASEDHCWLAGGATSGSRGLRWVKTKSLVCDRKTQRSWVLKVAPATAPEDTWAAGWIAGLYDGEGSLVIGPGSRLVLSQNHGPVLEQAEAWLRDRGFDFEIRKNRDCSFIQLRGGLKEQLRLLMLVRPGRLIRKLQSQLEELSLYGRDHHTVGLVSKEFLGEQEVIALATTTKTFVAEGLASHNCNFWRAVTAAPEAVAAAADWPVNEADLHARHRWLVNQAEFRERMHIDPDFFDVKIAGWWVWGLCQWIGGGWCVEPQPMGGRKIPKLDGMGKGVHSEAAGHGKERNARWRTRPKMSGTNAGEGVHSPRARGAARVDEANRPELAGAGKGVHSGTANQRKRPVLDGTALGRGVHSEGSFEPKRQVPMLSVGTDGGVGSPGRGVHGALSEPAAHGFEPKRQLPFLTTTNNANGQGVHAAGAHLPSLGNDRGLNGVAAAPCVDWFLALQARLRRVRVACGDWQRVLGDSVLGKGKNVGGRRPCAVFLDPPYSHEIRDPYLYSEDAAGVSDKVRVWALEHGDDPDLRIALCGYAGEHEMPKNWTEHAWKGARGYAAEGNTNRELERIWFSPHCLGLTQQGSLFERTA